MGRACKLFSLLPKLFGGLCRAHKASAQSSSWCTNSCFKPLNPITRLNPPPLHHAHYKSARKTYHLRSIRAFGTPPEAIMQQQATGAQVIEEEDPAEMERRALAR